MADAVGLGAQAPSLQQSLAPISSILGIQGQMSDVQAKKELAKQEQLKTQMQYSGASSQVLAGLFADERIQSGDPAKAREALAEGVDRAIKMGVPKEYAYSYAAPLFSVAEHSPQNLPNIIKNTMLSTISTKDQLEKAYPNVAQTDTGGNIVTTATGNPNLAVQKPGTPTGPYLTKTLAPTVATSATGAPMQFGGGGVPQGGNINPQGVQPQQMRQPVAPSGATQGMNQAYADKNAGGMLQPAPGETYQGYQNRVNRLTTLPTAANQSLSTQNRDSIPNMEYNNDQILKLLEKKDLDVGPVASWVAGNTKGITLTPDQQEIQKYLEQRSRQEATRSNQDQDSVYKAYGSFGTSKPALRDIIYNDKGVLASQKLYNQGILNVQGNPNKPNLSAINNFEQNYTKLAGDRNLVNLMGVIGDKSLEQLSNTDRQHLKKVFGNMSQDQINDLFAKRQQLLNLVNGR